VRQTMGKVLSQKQAPKGEIAMKTAKQQQVTGAFVERICHELPCSREVCKEYKVIDIRTVAEQFYSSYNGIISLDIFETVMPPFNKCIFEFQGGMREFEAGFDDQSSLEIEDMAVAVEIHPVSNEDHIRLNALHPGNDFVWLVSTRWFFTQATMPGVEIMRENVGFYLNREGRLLRAQSGALLTAEYTDCSQNIMTRLVGIFLCPVLFALTLMHCKNVNLATVTTPLPLSMKKSKRRKQIEERKKHPAFERHVVVIRNRKGQIVQRGLGRELAASHKRMHLVRGHFSTYSEAAPLFGRVVGRFWIPAHLSGLASEGVIDSDYRLEAA
jgi:hypothetical protein